MLYFVTILCIILLLAAVILLYMPMYVEAEYIKNSSKSAAEVRLSTVCFKKKLYPEISKKIEVIEKELSDMQSEGMLKSMNDKTELLSRNKDGIIDVLRYLSKKAVVIDDISVKLRFGFESKPATGIMTGALCAFIYGALGVIHRLMTIKDCETDIAPDFDNQCFDAELKLKLRLRMIYIIVLFTKIFKIIRNEKKF